MLGLRTLSERASSCGLAGMRATTLFSSLHGKQRNFQKNVKERERESVAIGVRFESEFAAAQAHDKKVLELDGRQAKLNFPVVHDLQHRPSGTTTVTSVRF